MQVAQVLLTVLHIKHYGINYRQVRQAFYFRKKSTAHWEQVIADPASLLAEQVTQFVTNLVQGEHNNPLFYLNLPAEQVSQVLFTALQAVQSKINTAHVTQAFPDK